MLNLALVEPTISFKEQYINMMEEWEKSEEKLIPFVLRYDYSSFENMVEQLVQLRDKPELVERSVKSSTFWLIKNGIQLIGVVNIRHELDEYLRSIGGHIGFGIRPSERRKGYATELLRLALIESNRLGLQKVLVTCDNDNVGSAKTIINNGGVLDSEIVVDGVKIQRYWIDLNV